MKALALDPGERVGWARAEIDLETGAWSEFRHGITPLRDMALAVHRALTYTREAVSDHMGMDAIVSDPQYDTIVVEDWRLYPHMARTLVGSSFPAVQFIGMVRLCCWLSGTQLVMQGAQIKSTADKTAKILRPELYELMTRPVSHDDGHDLDAIRHLWFWTYKHVPVVPEPLEAT